MHIPGIMYVDKSTDGGLSSHGGKVEIDEVKISFCLKPIADKSVLIRRPRGRIWFGCLSKSFVNRSSKAQFRAGLKQTTINQGASCQKLAGEGVGITRGQNVMTYGKKYTHPPHRE